MEFIKQTCISTTQPGFRSGLWLKPVEGGFEAYLLDSGRVLPLKLVDGNAAAEETTVDEAMTQLIGSVQDKKNANTIFGAKNYAKEQVKAIVGKAGDTAEDLTLHGLKAYIDAKKTKSSK